MTHEKHCPTKNYQGHPWHPGSKCPGCTAIRAAVAEQQERDGKIVQDFPLAESVWSKPAKAGIAAAIRGQQP